MNDSTQAATIEITPEMIDAGVMAFDKWLEQQAGEDWFVSSPPYGSIPSLILAIASSVSAPLSNIQTMINEHKS
jgi:hypothetical protein